ncbi:MAG TPA: rhodanese-like domain-containing protein [Campylobacterales bacterium]|nr:rhodanese-like domain-containing protein [Campylobacterales bacterium]
MVFRKTLLLLAILTISLIADLENRYPTLQFIKSGVKIIDIRTESEWLQTGILPGSYPITFFDERGNYNVSDFLSKLNRVVEDGEEFALICRTGHRSSIVSKFLSKNGYDVINLVGGINYAIHKLGIKTTKYQIGRRYY